MNMTLFRDTY